MVGKGNLQFLPGSTGDKGVSSLAREVELVTSTLPYRHAGMSGPTSIPTCNIGASPVDRELTIPYLHYRQAGQGKP